MKVLIHLLAARHTAQLIDIDEQEKLHCKHAIDLGELFGLVIDEGRSCSKGTIVYGTSMDSRRIQEVECGSLRWEQKNKKNLYHAQQSGYR